MPTQRPLNLRHGLSVGTKQVADASGILVDVGNLAGLLTTDKTSIVAALNEVDGNVDSLTTADVAEDPASLYFTTARARESVSVTDAGGDGSLSYDNVSGIFTYTGPSASEVRAHFSGGTGVTITDGTIAIGQPVATTDNVIFNDATLTGVLYGPANFVIDPAAFGDNTGTVSILGNLQVQGTTTTVNSTTVEIEDKNIVLAKSATNAAQADGGGITVNGANAQILYSAASNSWRPNLNLEGVDGSAGLPTYAFASDPSAGLYRSANDQVSLATNGLERLRVSNTLVTLVNSVNLVLNRGTYDGTLTTTTLSANRTYTLPNVSGTLVTTGDTGTVTSAMIADGTIIDADISATAEIDVSKLADGAARQLLQTAADGVTVQWTDNIDVPGTLDVTGVATFDTKIGIGTGDVGTQQLAWNPDEGTLDLGLLNGVVNQIGQELQLLCRNGTASTIPDGTGVMFTGTIGNSGRIVVAPMVADGTYPGYVFFGITTQSIASGADGYVTTFGKIRGIPTNIDEGGGVVWQDGDILWCDPATPGGFTKVEPLAPNLKLPVAAVINAANNGVLMVRVDTGRRLQDLHDVDANGATTDGDLLQYNASASRWEYRTDVTLPGRLVLNGTDITESARDIEESRLIRKNATVSIGIPGTVPFGVGPIIPPGMSLVGIGPDSYNVIDIYSGSVC